MAYIVSDGYKQIIYSGDARNKLKLLFNNVELQDADRYCEKLTIKSRIIPNGAKIFSLNNFISKEAELILHDIDTSIIQDQVSISIGTLVGNSYEYVPIGIFNIENQPTNDKNRTTIKLRDNSIKFDFNYNAQPLIEENGGSATKLQILRDICTQAGVTCNITSFIGYLDEIGVYDNTISAREYVSRIAEQAGEIATINRNGALIFVDLNDLKTWEIPIEVVEKYESGTKFKIGKVVYEDGIVRYETPDSNDDTLFLDSSNDYINNEKVLGQAMSNYNQYDLEGTNDDDLAYMRIDGQTTQDATPIGKNLLCFGNVSNALGLTITKTNNSQIRITGTSNAAGNISIPLSYAPTLTSQPYTLSITTTGTVNKTLIVGLPQSTTLNNLTLSSQYTERTSTNENGKTIQYFQIIVQQSLTTFTNFVVQVQLEQNSSATTFENFIPPTPNPSEPKELVSVGYENLFDSNTIVMSDYVGTNPTIRASSRQSLYLEKGTYTFSTDLDLSTYGVALAILPNVPPSSSWNATQDFGYITSAIKTFTVNTAGYFVATFKKGSNATFTLDEINPFKYQLEKGNIVHSYIPYGKYGIEVKTIGKNLFNLKDISNVPVGVTYTKIDENNVDIVNTSEVGWKNIRIKIDNIKKNTTYKFKGNFVNSNPNLTTLWFAVRNEDASADLYNREYSSGSIASFNSGENTSIYIYLYVNAYNTSGALVNTVNWTNLQLEEDEITTYEPYKENTYLYQLDEPLRSIEDTKDLLYIKNGYLYVDRMIGSVVLNGSENWALNSSSNGSYRYWIRLNNFSNVFQNIIVGSESQLMGNLESNRFIQSLFSNTGIGNFSINNTTGNNWFLLNVSNSSLATFKTWLSNNNVEVQYPLAEPYTETLGLIETPQTYNGVTYIDIESNIHTYSYVKYRKQETQLEAILEETNQFNIDSLKTGKILGNPAIDSYDLIQIHDKSRNIFDKNNINLINAYYVDGTGKIVYGNNNRLCWLKLQPNTTYTLTQTIVSNVNRRVALFDNEPTANLQGTLLNNFSGANPIKQTFTTTNTSIYVAWVYCNLANLNGYTEQKMLDSIQLEKGNAATDYVPFKDETYTTLATNDLVYTGVLINTFDTQIGEEAKEQNVFINGEETFKKWAKTKIDNVEGTLTLQAGEINEVNGKINSTTLQLSSQGALLNVLANNSNIDVEYDNEGNPLSGEVREVTTTTGFTFNAEGMTIEDSNSNFKALHRNDGTYYKEGEEIVGQYTKDGSKQKDLQLFGVYYYGMRDKDDTPMFVAQLYTDNNGEECFGHFYNRGD